MTLLSAQTAAALADGVYDIVGSSSGADALTFASRSTRLSATGAKPIAGLGGRSGAFVKEKTGFGLVMERGSGFARELIVVFRGTRFDSSSDWLTNLNTGMEPGPGGSIVHGGFNRVYKSCSDELSSAIRRAKPSHIHFVGHSLGGAIASIAATDYAGVRNIPSSLYTFGAPRVGSVGFCTNIGRCLPASNVKRVYAISDPVPMIPLLPFLHFNQGATGFNGGFTSITTNAHSMDICYRPRMPQHGWPAAMPMPTRTDPMYWINRAASSTSMLSSVGYLCLGQALALMMPMLHALGITISIGTTVLDQMIDALRRAVHISAVIGDTLLAFVKAALRVTGQIGLFATLTVGDLTARFLRYVFDLLYNPVAAAARIALNRLS